MALVLAALLGLFMSLVGVALIASPFSAVQAFGIDPSHMADIALAPGMGVRELAIGLDDCCAGGDAEGAGAGRGAADRLNCSARRFRDCG